LNPCHSQLTGNLTVHGLWYAYLGIILSVPSVGWFYVPCPECNSGNLVKSPWGKSFDDRGMW
jgi:hypothetical protein